MDSLQLSASLHLLQQRDLHTFLHKIVRTFLYKIVRTFLRMILCVNCGLGNVETMAIIASPPA